MKADLALKSQAILHADLSAYLALTCPLILLKGCGREEGATARIRQTSLSAWGAPRERGWKGTVSGNSLGRPRGRLSEFTLKTTSARVCQWKHRGGFC